MTTAARIPPHRVVVLVRPRVLTFELSLVHRLFGQARSGQGDSLYTVLTCAVRPGEVVTDTDFLLQVRGGLNLMAEADTVIVPGSADDFESDAFTVDPAIVASLAQCGPETRVASICTGSFVLAAAGLLDGKTATTHWRSSGRLQRSYPSIEVEPDALYTDNGNVLTSAGAAAGIDLCLHMIRLDHGTTVANEVARLNVVPPHREGGQKQYIARPVPDEQDISTVRARSWALENLHRAVSLQDLADCEHASTRTFTRRFRAETGTSPLHWLTARRLEHACELLESTRLSIDQIAAQCGFGSVEAFRLRFRSQIGVPPSAYRKTFAADR